MIWQLCYQAVLVLHMFSLNFEMVLWLLRITALKVYVSVECLYAQHPILGHRQTVQTQIRCRRNWHLSRVYTVCPQEFLFEREWKWKSIPVTPKFVNGLVQFIRMEKSIGQIRVNHYGCEDRLLFIRTQRLYWSMERCCTRIMLNFKICIDITKC